MTTNTTEATPSQRVLAIILEQWPHIAAKGVDETDRQGIWARVLDGLTPEQTERGIDWLLAQTKPVTFPAPIREAALAAPPNDDPKGDRGESVAAWGERVANLAVWLGVPLTSEIVTLAQRCVEAFPEQREWVKRRKPGQPERELPWKDADGLAEAVAKNMEGAET